MTEHTKPRIETLSASEVPSRDREAWLRFDDADDVTSEEWQAIAVVRALLKDAVIRTE
ncbi:hypothetical protein [Antribacter gilvus]|uniref:hypothetical protein n=1 Tax=Antribacter gilvus TaxID=2304675 RepID=UPI0013E0C8E9|nr:hypothetical protein [Antribacter gilvus]